MIGRRALLVAGALLPLPARAQRFYQSGTKERRVRFSGSGNVTLEGTLLLPIWSELQRVPGVVLIAGSGPTDRDGNNPIVPERIDLLRLLAELLAGAGIASLRYDKRGIGASTARPHDRLEAQEEVFAWRHFVADVQAAHAELLRHDEIKNYATGLVGHSEGGLLALAAATAMGTKRPHALVLLSTPGKPLRDIVRSQIARRAPQYLDETNRAMAAIEATGRVPGQLSPALQAVFPIYGGPFFKAALPFDPAAALGALDCSCLVLHGAADTQVVAMEDVAPLMKALGNRQVNGELFVVPGASHNLKSVLGNSGAGFAGPIVPSATDKFTSWLAQAFGP
jgi:alpha-beta hydrolase superfamily lysophospholipase